MRKIEINDKEYKVPETLKEMTFETYCRAFHGLDGKPDEETEAEMEIRATKTHSVVLSRLLGEPDDFMLDLPIGLYNEVSKIFEYVFTIPDDTVKNGITLNGKRFTVPEASRMEMRQYIDANIVYKEEESHMKYIRLLSTLLIPEGGKYDPAKTPEIEGMLRDCSVEQALPIVRFFFLKAKRSLMLSQTYSQLVENLKQYSTQNS